ncbi:response regulator [Roseomonas elaeocarpi]|uniref:Response regulator n=1 Tax=Roseomonas elaeocarpi TaxID=907779 RepID=A0ABV6JRS2_9PROT
MPDDAAATPPARHILLVEDEAVVRDVIAEILSDDGMVVSAYPSAESLLRWMPTATERPHAMILDVLLGPGLDGFALAAQVRERWPGLPVIFVSGDLRPLVRLSGRNDLCLMKPFTADVLLHLVHDL